MKYRVGTLNQFRFLLLANLDSKLAKISAHGVPVLLLRLVSRQVLEIVDVRIERKWPMRLGYHCLAHLKQQLAEVERVLKPLRVLAVQFHSLLFDFDFVPLVVLHVAPVQHPKV